MTQVDTFGVYVRDRLDEWGDEFALSRDCEYLGHQRKNILQVLIDHKGEMPGRAQGFKPLEVSLPALEVEFIVTDIARENLRRACILRAYFCGQGRRKVERWETARLLIATAEARTGWQGPLPNVRGYLAQVEMGIAEVRGVLRGIALGTPRAAA